MVVLGIVAVSHRVSIVDTPFGRVHIRVIQRVYVRIEIMRWLPGKGLATHRSYGLLRPHASSPRWSAHPHVCLRRDAQGTRQNNVLLSNRVRPTVQ